MKLTHPQNTLRLHGWDSELLQFFWPNAMFVGDLTMTITSTERQKRTQNLAPVLVIISRILWNFLGKLLPVLLLTGAAPPACQHR